MADGFPAAFYNLRNTATGMYLGAHPDGLVIAEDDSTNHHDVVWKILPGTAGGIALRSCHSTFLTARQDGGLDAASKENTPDSGMQLNNSGGNTYTLQTSQGTFLSAVPPVDGQPQVVTIDDPLSDATQWEITEVSTARGDLDGAAGKVF